MSQNPFRYFKTSPDIIQLAVMMYVRFPLSLRNVGSFVTKTRDKATALKFMKKGHETVRESADCGD
nr:hypothetical protein [uncultured Hyphomonas sp.]